MLRVTVKGLIAHKLRFALTALAVILGVAFMSGSLVLTDTVKRTFDNLFTDVYKGTDAYVRSRASVSNDFAGDQRERVSSSLIPQIERVEGVKAVDGNLQFYAQLVDKKGKAIGNPGNGPPTFGLNWSDVAALEPYRLERGGHPPRTSDQVAIDAGSAENGHFKVGERVKILTQQAPKDYEIAGIAKFGDTGSAAGATAALFSTETAQAISGARNQFDSISVVGQPGLSESTLQHRIRGALDDPKSEVLTGAEITKETKNDVESFLTFFNSALLVFAAVALLVGSFIIFNTFSIVVAQRIREMALLRAIGANSRQVMLSVLGESTVVGLLASLVGLAAGVAMSSALKALLNAFGFDIPGGGVIVNARTIIVSIVIGLVVTVASSIFPAWRASRVPPVVALRGVEAEARRHTVARVTTGVVVTLLGMAALLFGLFGGASNGIALVGLGAFTIFIGVTLLAPVIARPVSGVIGSPLPRVKGITGTIARENAMRNPKRTSATAAALMIGVALVGFITIFAASIKRTIDVQVDRAFRADYVITTGGFGGGGFSPRLATDVAGVPQVAHASGLRFNAADVGGTNHFLVAANPGSVNALFDLDLRKGNFDHLGTSGIAISTQVVKDKHWTVGTQVPVKFPTGPQTLKVEAIYGNGQRSGLSDYLISTALYEKSYSEQLVNQVYVKLKPDVSPAGGRRAIDKVLEPYPTAKLRDQTQFKQDQADQINQLLNLIYVLLFFAVLIAAIGIANTLALSIYERTRELGLLRAVGMTRRQLRSSVRWESVIIALLGTLLGLLIAFFFGWSVIRALRDEGITQFAAPPAQMVPIVVGGAIVGIVAAILPARRAAKLDVLTAITHE